MNLLLARGDYACTYRTARGPRCCRPAKWDGRRVRCVGHRALARARRHK